MQGPLSGDDGDQVECQIFADFSQERTTPIFRDQDEQTTQSCGPLVFVEDLYLQQSSLL